MQKIIYAFLDSRDNRDAISSMLSHISLEYGCNLELLSYNDISAVYSEKVENSLNSSKSDILNYASLIEKLFMLYTVLPVRYGSVIDSSYGIASLIKNNYEVFLKTINQVFSKDEYSIKVLLQHNVNNILISDSEQLNSIPDGIVGDTPVRNYLANKYALYLGEEVKRKNIDTYKILINNELQSLTNCFRFKNNPLPSIVIDLVLLLERSQKQALFDFVKKLQDLLYGHNILLTGPWPPYNFSNIELM